MVTVIIQILFSVPLFFIITFFSKKNVSLIQRILIPVVYMVVLASAYPDIKNNIYLVVIFEFILHEFYVNYIVDKNLLLNKKEFFVQNVISIGLSFLIYDYYISKVDNLLPLPEEFRGLLWFLIILFIYGLLRENIKTSLSKEKVRFIEQKREYVIVTYAKFKNKYYRIIKSKNIFINRLTYAIMIYENYKNPYFWRKMNLIKNRFTNCEAKYGIMQVESNKEIDDDKSIKLTMTKLEKKYEKYDDKTNEKEIIIDLLNAQYSKENLNNIIDIYNEIVEFENR